MGARVGPNTGVLGRPRGVPAAHMAAPHRRCSSAAVLPTSGAAGGAAAAEAAAGEAVASEAAGGEAAGGEAAVGKAAAGEAAAGGALTGKAAAGEAASGEAAAAEVVACGAAAGGAAARKAAARGNGTWLGSGAPRARRRATDRRSWLMIPCRRWTSAPDAPGTGAGPRTAAGPPRAVAA